MDKIMSDLDQAFEALDEQKKHAIRMQQNVNSHPHKPTDTDSGVDEWPVIPQHIAEIYWGKDWPGDAFPAWDRYGEEQKQDMNELLTVAAQSIKQELEALLDKQEFLLTDNHPGPQYSIVAVPVSVIQERLKKYE